MKYIKVVLKKVGSEDRTSVYARGKYQKNYRPKRWVQTTYILDKVGYGLCVFEFPNKTSVKEILEELKYMNPGLGLVPEVWECEVDGLMDLPEYRLPIYDFKYVHPKQIKKLSPASVEYLWPRRTVLFKKVKLSKRIGILSN